MSSKSSNPNVREFFRPPSSRQRPEENKRETTITQYLARLNTYLSMEIADVLEFNCPQTVAQDWDNVPEKSTQITLYIQKHVQAITKHLKAQLELESTLQLRQFTEDKLAVNDNRITEFEEKTDMEILQHSNNFNGLETRVNNHIKDILESRKRWLYEYPNENISQLYIPENQV